jgi:hypothetical protein
MDLTDPTPHVEKGPDDRYVLELMGWHMLLASKKLAIFTVMNQGVEV